MADLYSDPGQPDYMFFVDTPTRLCLNFTGKVSRVPTVGALPLVEAFGEQLYVDGSGVDSLLQD